ncbi:hypothetical protein M6B38_273520 [Iris pallida]|uniref:Uncharacterized protein n=1 Tax=Iris pallida TaxID=29817 RepID=A0AAX6EYB4_IRIPA|nr:hypothetical protein M6B38_165350 [Iris pallida]KAJ6848279.1 hypothetical protein M6B38_273520 [Iris pallida]
MAMVASSSLSGGDLAIFSDDRLRWRWRWQQPRRGSTLFRRSSDTQAILSSPATALGRAISGGRRVISSVTTSGG